MKIGFDLMDGIDTPKIGRVFAMLERQSVHMWGSVTGPTGGYIIMSVALP